MFDCHPALIARCAGAADVVRAVNFARSNSLLVAVRGGGHSLSGQSVCDDGLMIDLSAMRSVCVDPARRLARAGGGALLGDLDRETLPFGLVTTTGTVSHTGAGGLTLGGGFGRLARRFGLTCDQLSSVDIVTADGELLEASATENPDLFWAIRGGGGNFGIATSFEYRLHPFDGRAVGGHLVFPFEQARQALRGFAELFDRAPDGLWIEPVLTVLPGGARVLVLDVCLSEGLESAEAALAPYRQLGRPIKDAVGPLKYVQLQTQNDERARIGGRRRVAPLIAWLATRRRSGIAAPYTPCCFRPAATIPQRMPATCHGPGRNGRCWKNLPPASMRIRIFRKSRPLAYAMRMAATSTDCWRSSGSTTRPISSGSTRTSIQVPDAA